MSQWPTQLSESMSYFILRIGLACQFAPLGSRTPTLHAAYTWFSSVKEVFPPPTRFLSLPTSRRDPLQSASRRHQAKLRVIVLFVVPVPTPTPSPPTAAESEYRIVREFVFLYISVLYVVFQSVGLSRNRPSGKFV